MRVFIPLVLLCIGVGISACRVPERVNAAAHDDDSVEQDYTNELPRIAAVEPADTLENFEVLSGYRMELVAAEPLVHDPIAMAFDEFGRAFVVEMRGYSEERDKMVGAVRLLIDTDGDGVFDESHKYVDGLAWPTAVGCYDGGIYVAEPPNIWYCKDTDGDFVADVKEKVFTGFHLTNVQGLVNTFKWGLDNRIHGATSSSGADVRRPDQPEEEALSLKGRDFSFDPKTLEIRPESGGAQHGLSFNQWGEEFVCSNSDHIQQVMYEDRYIARNPNLAAQGPRVSIAADGPAADVFRISPVEPWRIVRTRLRIKGIVPGPVEGGGKAAGYFTSATGVTIYLGDAMPELVGNAFIGDVGSNLVHRKNLVGDGLVYRAERVDAGTEFVRSKDIWFRPAQFCNGPDGALYILDMYREVIEHPESLPPVIKDHLDLNSGNDRGRIYRVVPEGFVQPERPMPGAGKPAEWAALLTHANGWTRETAARLIYERRPTEITSKLEEIAATAPTPEGRIRALHALDTLGFLASATLSARMDDTEARVRQQAARLAGDYVVEHPELAEKLTELAVDDDLRVRYAVAFALGELSVDERITPLAVVAAQNPENSWIRLAVLSSLAQGAGRVAEKLMKDATFLDGEDAAEMLGALAQMAGASGDSADVAALLRGAQNAGNEALTESLVQALAKGMGRQSLEAGSAAEGLLADLVSEALAVLGDESASTDARVAALGVARFGNYDAVRDPLAKLLAAATPETLQVETVRALTSFDKADVAETILAAWKELSGPAKVDAVQRMSSRAAWLKPLLAAVGSGMIPRTYFNTTLREVIASNDDTAVQALAKQVFEQPVTQDVAEITAAVLAMNGDAQRGMMLFSMNCAVCHTIGGVGLNLGPDLSTVGNGGKEKILMNIINPNAEVNPQYFNYIVETMDFETFSGILVADTATSVTLRQSGGREETVLKKDIEKMLDTGRSIMPEDWGKALGNQGLADVTEYLSGYGG